MTQLRRHALQIWQAGVDAVRSERLVRQSLRVEGASLRIGNDAVPLSSIRRIMVVGAGKAGTGMAEAVENALGTQWMAEKQLAGWVNVPDNCVRPLKRIHLHAARPAGVNEPMPEGVAGTLEILRLVESLGPDDLCLCLISGGGSALMPAPVEGVTLADKLAVTRFLSEVGANIEQLNTVRKQLSRVKGGGLLRACRAGRLASLIISDVLGDPLEIIASGPTVPNTSTPQAALDVLKQFSARSAGIADAVFNYLQTKASQPTSDRDMPRSHATNHIIGNNATAVAAAEEKAKRLGYAVAAESASHSEGLAEDVGRRLANEALKMRSGMGPTCFISGGEPVVKLIDASRRGLGGRNQQLTLAALSCLTDSGASGIAMLSGGTDGEDGPTDAAGAFLDDDVLAAARQKQLDPADYLARNDAYRFFAPLDALIKTGPTHTNVCDLRVIVAAP
jgi:hydroxypyruvate reductase